MREIQELVDISATHRVENVEMLDPEYHQNATSKTGKLFSLLRRHAVATDDEAQAKLGIGGRKAYLMLKSRLRKRILNYLFFIDVGRVFGNTRVGYEFLAHRSLFSSRLLFAIGATSNGKHFADIALQQAKKYDLTEVHVQSLQLLRSYYSEQADLVRVQAIHTELLDVLAVMRLELFLEDIYQRVRARYRADEEARSEILGDLEDELQLSMLAHDSQSKTLVVLHHNIERIKHALKLEHRQAMRICERALESLKALKYVSERETADFTLAFIRHAICARDYAVGESFIIENLHTVKDGSEQWFLLMRYYFLLATNCANIQEAELLYVSATQHRMYSRTNAVEKQHWRVFGALLLITSEFPSSQLTLSSPAYYDRRDCERLLGGFETGNELSAEWQPHILILTFMHALAAGNTRGLLQVIEKINSFLHKEHTSEAQFRTIMFLQMLAMFDAELSTSEIQLKQQELFAELTQYVPDYRGTTAGLEIVQYEYLWMMMYRLATDRLL